MPAATPSERHLIARAAAHQSCAATPNRSARTSNARTAFLAKFEDQVDPDRLLPAEERTRRATNARKAYFADLARKSAAARRADRPRRQLLEELVDATRVLVDLTGRGIPPAGPDTAPVTSSQAGGAVR